MSNPTKPAWPDLTALPFLLFGSPGAAGGASTPNASPLVQGFAGGMDAVKNFWGSLPGGTALPGFLVPTVDVEELDKRISDLRAAESWLEVNLNMLRATIQGLQVQRHTISAIQSLSAMSDAAPMVKTPSSSASGGLPAGWPMSPPAPAPVAKARPEPPAEAPPASEPAAPLPEPKNAVEAPTVAPMLAGLATNNWLGFMQDQFAKVAQAALATSDVGRKVHADATAKAPAGKAATKASAKKARTGRAPARKGTGR